MSTSSSASSASKPSGQWQPPTLEEMQTMLPQYQFISLLGRGGMGAVYKAVQVTLDRAVAIKVLPGDLIDDTDAQFAERFKNEARTMARMNHPSIVNVYDFGETNTGLLYIVMEFIDGTDVSKMIISQGKLPEDYALSITAHVSDALAYAHKNGVIHRDIKPANILINMEGVVKVADFGLAKANDAGQSGITKTNMAMGTPDFVAPEALIPGIPLDGRADLYAMGVMLYQMLTGEIPRGMWTMPSVKLGTDPRFDAIISKAMQTDREARYQSAAELRQHLDTILTLPRAALIQQQQAAAEATARATRAQEQAASGPQRRPISSSQQEAPPPGKKQSKVGPVLGALTSVILLVGLAYVLRGPEHEETRPEPKVTETTTAPTPTSLTAIPPPAMPEPSTTRASDEKWVDGLSHIFADPKQSQRLQRQPDGSALAVASTDLWPMAIDGSPLVDQAVRMTGRFGASVFNLSVRRTENHPDAAGVGYELKWLPGSNKLVVGRVVPDRSFGEMRGWKLPPGTDREASHSLEFRAVGDQLTVSMDGRKIGELKNSEVSQGVPHLRVAKGAVIERFEYADLGGTPTATAKPPVTIASSSPAMTPPPVTPTTLASSPPAMTPASATPVVADGVAPALTKPVDLLKLVDLQRDPVKGRGTWETNAAGLVMKNDTTSTQTLAFNAQPLPEEYDYEIEFTLATGAGHVVQVFSVDGHYVGWEMSGLTKVAVDPAHYAFGPVLDGKPFDQRQEAVVMLPRLQSGQRHRSVVEVRKGGSLRAVLDGTEVLAWRGDVGRFDPGLHAPPAGLQVAALSAYGTSIIFHKAELRPPLHQTDPRLVQLEKGFQSHYETVAQKPFLAAIAALNQSYLASGVARARAKAQADGKLQEVIALDEVKARIQRGEGVPDEDEPGTPASLKSLRTIYRNALAKITAERAAKAAPLYDLYLKALDIYIAELTKANNVSKAQTVKSYRQDIAAAKTALTASQSKEVAAAPPVATPPAAPAASTPPPAPPTAISSTSSWRTAALFLVSNGGNCVVEKGGARFTVTTEKDIPSGRFDVVELNLDRYNSLLPPLRPADLQPLMGLRDLRSVYLRPMHPGLTDAGLAFLAGNSDLTSLNLEGAPDITDEALAHLVGAKKLQMFRLTGAPGFTGKGLEQMPFLDSLTEMGCEGVGLSDAGLNAIAKCKNLRVLRISEGTITENGFTALRGMKSLGVLSAQNCVFGDEAAAVIASLTNLTELHLGNTKLTDLGLKKLLPLKKLIVLNLGGSAVTLEAAAEFQKARPQCRVSR